MKTFKDTTDRTWNIMINVSAIKQVRSALDVDLLGIIEGSKVLEKLIDDPVTLCDVLYVLIKPQADAQQVTDEEFGAALGGDVLEKAVEALLGELIDFFPQAKRAALRRLLEKIDQLEKKVADRVIAEIDSGRLDQMLEQELDRALRTPGSSSGSARASPASTRSP